MYTIGCPSAYVILQRIILNIFDRMSIGSFKAFLDDWCIYSDQKTYLKALGECMERCCRAQIALNPREC